MSITVKLGELVAAEVTLQQIAKSKHVPFKASFHIARFLRKAGDDIRAYFERQNELVTEFGSPMLDDKQQPMVNEDGTPKIGIKPGAEKWAEFEAKFKELAETEVTLDGEPLSIDEMDKPVRDPETGELVHFAMEPERVMQVQWMFKD